MSLLSRSAVLGVLGLTLLTTAATAHPTSPERLVAVSTGPGVARLIASTGAVVEERLPEGLFLVRARAEDLRLLHAVGLPWGDVATDAEQWFHQRALAVRDKYKLQGWEAVEAELQQLARDYPELVRLEVLGNSVDGRSLIAVKVSDHPNVDEMEPAVRLTGAHHGDEMMGVEICLRALRMLVGQYGLDDRITHLVDDFEIWVVPAINPDGYAEARRTNGRYVDLNRNYGFMWEPERRTGSGPYSEPESQAMHLLAQRAGFVLSLAYHTAAAYVNYPWNHTSRATPDEPLISSISEEYAQLSGYTAINGWDWYQITGDADDHLYGTLGGINVTIETDDEDPDAVWDANREALLTYLERGRTGIAGRVVNGDGEPVTASIWVEEIGWPVHTRPDRGDFYRTMLPGSYTVRVQANGYAPITQSVEVVAGETAWLDVTLEEPGGSYAQAITTVTFWEGHDEDLADTPEPVAMLGAPDGYGFPLAPGGVVVLDLGADSPLVDGDGGDLQIHEANSVGAGYRVAVGTSPFGPWSALGEYAGTAPVDLAGAVAKPVRYLRIEDDGDDLEAPGLRLDAVEFLTSEDPAGDGGETDGGETGDGGPDGGDQQVTIPGSAGDGGCACQTTGGAGAPLLPLLLLGGGAVVLRKRTT